MYFLYNLKGIKKNAKIYHFLKIKQFQPTQLKDLEKKIRNIGPHSEFVLIDS